MQPGDIVRVEYDGWVEETGNLFDTTDEEKATSSDIYEENKPYGAIPIILGKVMVVAGFEKSLLETEVGEEIFETFGLDAMEVTDEVFES